MRLWNRKDIAFSTYLPVKKCEKLQFTGKYVEKAMSSRLHSLIPNYEHFNSNISNFLSRIKLNCCHSPEIFHANIYIGINILESTNQMAKVADHDHT